MNNISKSMSLIPTLRNLHSNNNNLSNKKWVKCYKPQLRALGRTLQFLRLADFDKTSTIGWKANSSFFKLVQNPHRLSASGRDLLCAADSEALWDMLLGMATAVAQDCDPQEIYFDPGDEKYGLESQIMGFIVTIFEAIGLLQSDRDGRLRPTQMLCDLVFEAVLQMRVARPGKLPPRRHEELPPPWLAEERANARGANHGKPVVE